MITNSYSEFKDPFRKKAEYTSAITYKKKVYAYSSNGKRKLLKDCPLDTVEYIAGVWRIQDEFPYKIETVRKKDFVIGEKLPHAERTLFDFYAAYSVGENCYGKFIFSAPDYVVAKYVTARGTYSAYGKTIEDARAYLGIKLYDEFQDVIHREINTQKQK